MYMLSQTPGRVAHANGQEYLFFSGYDYLGIGQSATFTNLVKNGIDVYGLLHPSSRISNTRLEVFDTFEHLLATITGCGEAVSFSSGFLAGKAVADVVNRYFNNVFIAPDTHSAIQTGHILLQGTDWKTQFIKAINLSSKSNFVLLMDGVNPFQATVANFSFLKEIHPDKHLTCIIDDSHGIGLIGPVGEGVSHLLPDLPNVEYVLSFSLSKSYHINGGAVCCRAPFAALLRQSTFYTASTAMSPALAYTFIHAQPYYIAQLNTLRQNIADFTSAIRQTEGICYAPQFPVFILTGRYPSSFFDLHQIIISSFAYPSVSGKIVNRVVVNALHTPADLKKLADVLRLAAAIA